MNRRELFGRAAALPVVAMIGKIDSRPVAQPKAKQPLPRGAQYGIYDIRVDDIVAIGYESAAKFHAGGGTGLCYKYSHDVAWRWI